MRPACAKGAKIGSTRPQHLLRPRLCLSKLVLGDPVSHALSMGKVDERVLTFFVSGALVAGSAACSKESKSEEPITNTAQHVDHVNEGPMPSQAIDAAPNAPALREPDHVNVAKEPDAEEGTPTSNPDAEKRKPNVNTRRVQDPKVSPEKPKRPDNVNTVKVPDPAETP